MGGPRKNVDGQRFGRLVALRDVGVAPGRQRGRLIMCQCDCGRKKNVPVNSLRRGGTKSCGCLQKETAAAIGRTMRTHGESVGTKAYMAWASMRARCLNPRNPSYSNYGGRGIGIAEEWNTFAVFLRDMGVPPVASCLDRIDNNAGYSGSNCRWTTAKTNQNNKRTNRRLTCDGATLTLSQWSDRSGVRPQTIMARIRAGRDTHDAIWSPTANYVDVVV